MTERRRAGFGGSGLHDSFTRNNAQNPLHAFPRNLPVAGEVANLLRTCYTANKSVTSWQQVVVMESGKRRDTTDTTDFYPRQLVADLLWTCRL